MKKKYDLPFDKFHAVMNFVIEEAVWYLIWWFELIVKFLQKSYLFGEWILKSAIKLIDKLDEFFK